MHFDLTQIGSEFHGFIRKRKMGPYKITKTQLDAMTEDMADEINFYFALEVKKRKRTQ